MRARIRGWTPLHYAAMYDSLHTIVALLDHGADPMYKTLEGKTAMDIAQRPKTKLALRGGMKQQLEKEALEKEMRTVRVRGLCLYVRVRCFMLE
jgi:hypothetical protein